MQPCNYFEDFENPSDFAPGTINGQGDAGDPFDLWALGCQDSPSGAQLSNANGASGVGQHLRLSYDPSKSSTFLACIVAARVPSNAVAQASPLPVNVTTVECDVAISAPFGSDFNIQPQSRGYGMFTTRTLFFYYGSIYVLDDLGGGQTYVNIGNWDTTGAYQTLSVTIDPCNDTIHYDYRNGTVVYDAVGGVFRGPNVDQFLVFHDNVNSAETYDVDNVRITRTPDWCPHTCGNGIIEPYGGEECETTPGGDAVCPGRCDPVNCMCARSCGGSPADPCAACALVPGVLTDEITTSAWFTFTAATTAYAFDTCDVVNNPPAEQYDSQLSVWQGTCDNLTLVEMNDDCDDNTGGYGVNADPQAPCFAFGGSAAPYPSCLCVATTPGHQYWVHDDRANDRPGRRVKLLATEHSDCAPPVPVGACCIGGTSCANSTQGFCELPAPSGLGGVYLGDGTVCPTQNVLVVNEGNGTVFVHRIGAPINCNPNLVRRDRRSCPGTGPYYDPWISPESAGMCHNFGSPDTNPIPADFFGPGSNPFIDSVCLRGVALGLPEFGEADTVIKRSADPFDRCGLPSADISTVNIEVDALSLEGTAPITVTYAAGPDEQWDVKVDRCPGGLLPGTPPSTLSAVKSHCNGGTFTSVLHVQPRFTFTKVGDVSQVRVLDTLLAGTAAIELRQDDPHPWISEADATLGLQGDPCTAFHANLAQQNPTLACDCNNSLVRDACDIEQGTSQDCNTNVRPGECDIASGASQDCNTNARPDECDIAQGVSLDCNANARPDECDISSGSSLDVNLDGVPDECAPVPPALIKGDDDLCVAGTNAGNPCAQHSDCSGGFCRMKNRFFTAVAPGTATAHGIKVNLVALDANSVATPANYDGTDRWAGVPSLNVNDGVSPPFNAAKLQCAFTSQDWSAVGLLHMYGDVVVPQSSYDASVCASATGPCSLPLRMDTAKFGDVIAPVNTTNFQDINSIVAKFQGGPSGPSKTRTKLTNSIVNPANAINFQEVSACVSAFQSKPFKLVVTAPPATCP